MTKCKKARHRKSRDMFLNGYLKKRIQALPVLLKGIFVSRDTVLTNKRSSAGYEPEVVLNKGGLEED